MRGGGCILALTIARGLQPELAAAPGAGLGLSSPASPAVATCAPATPPSFGAQKSKEVREPDADRPSPGFTW
jgi:hypothetical protein